MILFLGSLSNGDCSVRNIFVCVLQQITDLKKENFSLKLRIYFLEERMQQKYGDGEDVFKTVSLLTRTLGSWYFVMLIDARHVHVCIFFVGNRSCWILVNVCKSFCQAEMILSVAGFIGKGEFRLWILVCTALKKKKSFQCDFCFVLH